jgi:hypothetical protein
MGGGLRRISHKCAWKALQRFRKLCIRIQGSQVVATPRSDDPECCFDRTQYFRNRSRCALLRRFARVLARFARENAPSFSCQPIALRPGKQTHHDKGYPAVPPEFVGVPEVKLFEASVSPKLESVLVPAVVKV